MTGPTGSGTGRSAIERRHLSPGIEEYMLGRDAERHDHGAIIGILHQHGRRRIGEERAYSMASQGRSRRALRPSS